MQPLLPLFSESASSGSPSFPPFSDLDFHSSVLQKPWPQSRLAIGWSRLASTIVAASHPSWAIKAPWAIAIPDLGKHRHANHSMLSYHLDTLSLALSHTLLLTLSLSHTHTQKGKRTMKNNWNPMSASNLHQSSRSSLLINKRSAGRGLHPHRNVKGRNISRGDAI